MEGSIPPQITERMVTSCHEASPGAAEAAYICISRTYSMALGFGFFLFGPENDSGPGYCWMVFAFWTRGHYIVQD